MLLNNHFLLSPFSWLMPQREWLQNAWLQRAHGGWFMQDRHTCVKRDIISIAACALMHLFCCKLLRRLIHDHHLGLRKYKICAMLVSYQLTSIKSVSDPAIWKQKVLSCIVIAHEHKLMFEAQDFSCRVKYNICCHILCLIFLLLKLLKSCI